MESTIGALEAEAKQIQGKNQRNQATQKTQALRKELSNVLSKGVGVACPDKWLLDGLQQWIDTFLPGIVNLRIYPSIDRPDEHVFGHLKKECFCDKDASSVHFAYGSLPTGSLSVVGVITSVPEESGEKFNPLEEFSTKKLVDSESLENAFRNLFRGFDGLEQMIRTSRFPRIVVYPVLVYRTTRPAIKN